MAERPPSPPVPESSENEELTSESESANEASPESNEGGGEGPQAGTLEAEAILEHDRQERIQEVNDRLGKNGPEHVSGSDTQSTSAHSAGSSHAHSENKLLGAGKGFLALFGVLFYWVGQAIKRAPEMAGKGGGGGGHAKKDDHGGGGHH